MFGLGLWEWLLILFLATMLFGPRFIGRTFTSLVNSVKGFANSFQQGSTEAELASSSSKALKSGSEDFERAHS